MAINGISIKSGAAYAAVTGGTAFTMSDDKQPIANGIRIVDESDLNYFTRKTAIVKNRPPVKLPDGTYQKGKRSLVLQVPKSLASGAKANNLVRIEIETDPETTSTEVADLRVMAIQLLGLTSVDSFWNIGSMS